MILHFPETERIIVAYSGGKDSIVLSDLAVKHVKNVKLFFMYFIAGLDYTEHWCSFAEKRWGVEVHRMMSWTTTQLLHDGVFCRAYPVPSLKMLDSERAARRHFGWPGAWVATGIRLNDSLERRGMLNSWASGYRQLKSRRCAPIAEWSEREVYAYLQRAKLPIPDMGIMERTHGLTLQPQCMYWMRQNWPDDYKRVLKVFPLAAGQADRYERYNEEWQQQKKDRASKVRVRRRAAKRVEAGTVQSAQDRSLCAEAAEGQVGEGGMRRGPSLES